jgi:hypothetical protein
MGMKAAAIVADAPILFFAVVFGVAFAFRVGVGWMREAATPPVVAPTFVTGAGPTNDPKPVPAARLEAEVGAAASVQPIGATKPARVAPKTRGLARKPPRAL